ncbi:mechanosensitive ion channel family protein [Brevundimonas sp.]|uniref:mechanosensitive ion channel family protein n=1 Tax=Brevundimonas sp. TaxID=1871086 RepID=UPI002D50E8A4|nr:mechanosensitive ion channel family protein [Brevundimonas sp.]HYC96908.1 mechanosensitive ion channel family protein [Brevundimonas sp.]
MVSLPTSLNDAVAAGQQAMTLDAAVLAKLTDMAGDFAINLSIALIILVATVIGAKWASRITRRALSRVRGFRHDQTVVSFVVQVVRVVVYIIGFIAVLQRLGVQTTSIIAVLGAASLAVGLALQGTLSNVAAGVLLLVLRPYKVGDVIEVGGASGSVQRLDLFTTQLSNANNHKIVVPNAKVLGEVIVNLTGQKTRRIELLFNVGYSANLKQARAVLAGVAEAHDKVLPDPEPWAGVTNLLDSGVEVTLQAWVEVDDWWQVKADLVEGVKEGLDAAGIEIPFPHQVAVPYEPPAPGSDPVRTQKPEPEPQPPAPAPRRRRLGRKA